MSGHVALRALCCGDAVRHALRVVVHAPQLSTRSLKGKYRTHQLALSPTTLFCHCNIIVTVIIMFFFSSSSSNYSYIISSIVLKRQQYAFFFFFLSFFDVGLNTYTFWVSQNFCFVWGRCVCVCASACVRACVRACVCVFVNQKLWYRNMHSATQQLTTANKRRIRPVIMTINRTMTIPRTERGLKTLILQALERGPNCCLHCVSMSKSSPGTSWG